jgi:hypothetical protein
MTRKLLSFINFSLFSKVLRQLLLMGLVCFSVNVFAVTNTSLATGNWNDPTKWDQGHIPLSSEDAVVATGMTITVNCAAVCNNLTLNGTGNLQGASGRSITVSGNITRTGTGTINRGSGDFNLIIDGANCIINSTITIGSLTINASKKLTLAAAITICGTNGVPAVFTNNGTFDATANNTTVTFGFNSAGSFYNQSINGSNITFYNLTITGTDATAVTTENCDFNVNNSINLTNGSLVIGAHTLTLNAITGSNTAINGGTSSNITITGTGGPTLPAITNGLNNFTINKTSGAVTLGANLTVAGDLNITAGTLNCSSYSIIENGNFINLGTFTAGTGTVTFSGTGAQAMKSSSNISFYNLAFDRNTAVNALTIGNVSSAGITFSATNSFTWTGHSDKVIIGISGGAANQTFSVPAITIPTGSTLQFDATLATGLNVASDFLNNGTYTRGNETVTLSGTSNSIGGSSVTTTFFNNLTIATSAGYTINPSASDRIKVGGTFTQYSSSSLTIPASKILDLYGTSIIMNGIISAANKLDGTRDIDINNTADLSGSTGSIAADLRIYSGATTLSSNFNLDGDFIINSVGSATLTMSTNNFSITGNWINNGTFNYGTGTVTFNGTSAISGTGTPYSFYNLTISSSKTLTAPAALYIYHNFTNNSGTFTSGTGTVYFSGATGSISGTSTITAFNNITISSGTTIDGNTSFSVAGDWTNNGAAGGFNRGTSTVTFTGSSKSIGGTTASTFCNLTITGSVTLNNDIAIAGTSTPVTGTFTNNGNFTHNNHTVTLGIDGYSYNQLITGTSHPTNFYNLTITGTGTSTLNSDVTVNNEILISCATGYNSIPSNPTLSNSTHLTMASGSTIKRHSGTITSVPTFAGTVDVKYGYTTMTTGPELPISSSTALNNLTVYYSAAVTLNAIVNASGNFSITSGSLTVVNGSNNYNMTIGGDWTNSGGSFTCGTGTVTFDGPEFTTQQITTVSPSINPFYNVIINHAGTHTVNDANILVQIRSDINVNNDLTITDGTLEGGSGYNNYNLSVAGNWINNSTDDGFHRGCGTVTLTGSNKNIDGTSSTYFRNLTINGSYTILCPKLYTISAPTAAGYTTSADLTLGAGSSLNGNGKDIFIGGSWINNSGTSAFTANSNLVTFNAPGYTTGYIVQVIGGTFTTTFNHLTISNTQTSAPTVSLNLNTTAAGNILISSGTFNANGKNISVGGNWTNNSAFTYSSAQATTFNGNAALQTIGGSNATTFYNLTISNTNTDKSNVLLNVNNTQVDGALAMTNGALNLNSNTIIINNAATNAISRTNGYILSNSLDQNFSSKVQWNISSTSGDHIYPFGVDASHYIPFTFGLQSGTIGNVSLSTYPSDPSNTNNASTVFNNKPAIVTNIDGGGLNGNPGNALNLVRRFWKIEPTGSGTTNVTYTYADAEVPITGEDNTLRAQRYNTSLNGWETALASQTATNSTNTVYVPGVTNFSPWTIAKNSHPLPIELISFTSVCENNVVDLNWSTASETNNDFFTVERSKDDQTWESIATISGAGNSNATLLYSAKDLQPIAGLSYYRLKQTDFNGAYSYSQIVPSSCGENVQFDLLSVKPSNAENEIVIQFSASEGEQYTAAIYDAQGRMIQDKSAKAVSGMNEIHLNSPLVSEGIYLICLQNSKKYFSKKILLSNPYQK